MIFLLIIINILAYIHNKSLSDVIQPPINANYYMMEWNIFTTDTSHPPPINEKLHPEYIRHLGTGRTYYDWEERSMLEVYDNFCVPIFENPNTDFQFPCQFLNVNEKVYLRVFNNTSRPSCCLFAENFHPPLPSFAYDNNLKYNSTIKMYDNKYADFWSFNIPPPGPFWYGWYRESINGHRIPASFAFLTVEPEGWTIQNFFNYLNEKPSKEIFEIPKECKNVLKCVVFSNGNLN